METRRRFRLRRPSEAPDYELRVGDLRAFYRVSEGRVLVLLIGKKKGNELIIDGKRLAYRPRAPQAYSTYVADARPREVLQIQVHAAAQ